MQKEVFFWIIKTFVALRIMQKYLHQNFTKHSQIVILVTQNTFYKKEKHEKHGDFVHNTTFKIETGLFNLHLNYYFLY